MITVRYRKAGIIYGCLHRPEGMAHRNLFLTPAVSAVLMALTGEICTVPKGWRISIF
jgi:hypothetical protein